MNHTMIFFRRPILLMVMMASLISTISAGAVPRGAPATESCSTCEEWGMDVKVSPDNRKVEKNLLAAVYSKVLARGLWGPSAADTEAKSLATCVDCGREMEGYGIDRAANELPIPPEWQKPPGWVEPRTRAPNLPVGVVTVSGRIRTSIPGLKVQAGTFSLMGTGFMATKCHLITNHHVSFMGSQAENVDNLKIEVRQIDKSPDGSPRQTKSLGTVVAGEKYDSRTDSQTKDVVVIKLDKPLVDTAKLVAPCVGIITNDDAKDLVVSTASYYADINSDVPWGQEKCRVTGEEQEGQEKGLWKTNCPAIPGSSGSPVYSTETNGKRCVLGFIKRVVGKENYVMKASSSSYNIMIPFSSAFPNDEFERIEKKYPCDPVQK